MCSEPSNDRPAVKHYESKGGPIVHFGRGSQALLEGSKIFFSAYAGMPICPRLVVSDTFEWLDANALRLELHLNSSHPLVALPLPRQPNDEAIIVDLNKWPVWDGKNWMDARFSFEKVEENAVSRRAADLLVLTIVVASFISWKQRAGLWDNSDRCDPSPNTGVDTRYFTSPDTAAKNRI